MKRTPQNTTSAPCEAIEIARFHRQLEAVADEVGDRLDLGHLVVVGRDEGPLLALEPADLVPQPGDTRGLVLGQCPRRTSWSSATNDIPTF